MVEAGRQVRSTSCLIIAEAGVNHDGDLGKAEALVRVAARAGADAVKFQSFRPEKLVSRGAPKAAYQLRSGPAGESQFDMVAKLALSEEDHRHLARLCAELGILFLSTPFDEESVDLLDGIGVPFFKISSGDLTNPLLLEYVAAKGRPVVLSTGMARLGEVESALETLRTHGCPEVTLLHCVSAYPAPPEEVNLRAMDTLAAAFGVPVGYSDHTLGIAVPLAAVARGATVLEKHFTLDRNAPGPDHAASADEAELTALVHGIRTIERALGTGRKLPTSAEADTARVARRSIFVVRAIKEGERIDRGCLGMRRPGTGLPAAVIPFVVGRTARRDLPAETILALEDLA